MRRFIALALTTVLLFLLLPSTPVQAEPSGVFEQMLFRAETIANCAWVATSRISTWNGSLYRGRDYFEQGEVVVGMPYTLFSGEFGMNSLRSMEQYSYVAGDNYSISAYCVSVCEMRTGPIYGSCCATFLCEILDGNFMNGIAPRFANVSGVANHYEMTRRTVTANDILPGDTLYNTTRAHIIWVSSVTDKTITIYEQTPPVTRKVIIPKSSVTEDGFLYYNDKIYAAAARYDRLSHEGAHIPVTDEAVSPTCTEIGFTSGSHCAQCGLAIVQQKVIPAIGHTYTLIGGEEETDTVDGYNLYQCSVCDAKRTEYLPSPVCAANNFTDIPMEAWYHNSVDYAVLHKLMNGVGEKKFNPDGSVTRSMLVTILYRAKGEPEVTQEKHPFTDVPADQWYTKAVIWAANNGIVNGISPTTFEPDTAITREQIAAILYRYENPEAEALGDLTSYPDNGTVSDYAIPAMRWAVGEELITGSDGKLLPQNNATRAQIATILMRYLEKNH